MHLNTEDLALSVQFNGVILISRNKKYLDLNTIRLVISNVQVRKLVCLATLRFLLREIDLSSSSGATWLNVIKLFFQFCLLPLKLKSLGFWRILIAEDFGRLRGSVRGNLARWIPCDALVVSSLYLVLDRRYLFNP